MTLKNRSYMRNEEFKAKQLWLPFVDAVGIALEVMEQVKESAWTWFKEWRHDFRSKAPRAGKNTPQIPLPFPPFNKVCKHHSM